MRSRRLFLALLFASPTVLLAQESAPADGEKDRLRITLDVDGTERIAWASIPATAKEKPAPLVFVFHGHGGNALHAALSMPIHKEWPEAIVVYPQGLKTPGQITDPEGKKTGWQRTAGDLGDRDYKFFDALFAKLRADYKVDTKRVYSTGHSNGGSFTFLLWQKRPDVFAAVAPSAAVAARSVPELKPKPVLHLAGTNDPLVRYAWQEKMIEAVRRLNGCAEKGEKWGELGTLYPSSTGTPLVTWIHDQEHKFPKDGAKVIVKFFKEHAQK